MTSAPGPPSGGGRPAGARAALSRAAAWLGCAACVAASAAGCASVASSAAAAPSVAAARVSGSAPVSAPASSDPACAQALEAVRTYGLTVVDGKAEVEKLLDEAKVDLIVFALDAAARAANDPAAKQSISKLANAYLRLRDSWTDAAAQAVVSGTSNLNAVCNR